MGAQPVRTEGWMAMTGILLLLFITLGVFALWRAAKWLWS